MIELNFNEVSPEKTPGLLNANVQAARFACEIHPFLRHYDANRLKTEGRLPLAISATSTTFQSADWNCAARELPQSEQPGFIDLEVIFTLTHGAAKSTGVGVAFDFRNWSPMNYVLLPAAAYNGNNFDVSSILYPPLWRNRNQFRPDMPTTITDLPRLTATSMRIEQKTGDLASPCMGFYSPSAQQGFLVLTHQATRLGNSAMTVETQAKRASASFLVAAPGVREFRQDHCKAMPSTDCAADWNEGDSVTLRLGVFFFSAPKLQALFDRFCEIRKKLNNSKRHEELSFSAAFRILEEKYNRDNWEENNGYYKMSPNAHTTFEVAEDPLCFQWQLGWVGGAMMTLPMLAQGSPQTRERAWRNLQLVFEKTAAPAGFFYGIGDGDRFYGDGFDRPHPHSLHMVRKSGDWLYFALKQFDLLRKQNLEIPVAWLESIRKLAEAFVLIWSKHVQFGQFVDVETGELLIGGSTAGAIVPGALALASGFFNEPKYLAVAEAAANKFYAEFVCNGITTGGPGDILSAPDSESAFALLESFVVLLETTRDSFWQKAAGEMLRQAATWVVAYDYEFPPKSSMGRAGIRSTGAVWANVQNKHGAPGICTLSGDSMFRLWRATGDPLALDLIRDIAHGLPQYLSRADRPLADAMQPGWMCERVNLSDWEGAAGVGGNLFSSCSWPETALMLTTWEIPGLYVQPDTGFFVAFDNIVAEKISHTKGIVMLRLFNPTKFDAEVKVYCEPSTACKNPLGLNFLFGARNIFMPIFIPSGQSLVTEFV